MRYTDLTEEEIKECKRFIKYNSIVRFDLPNKEVFYLVSKASYKEKLPANSVIYLPSELTRLLKISDRELREKTMLVKKAMGARLIYSGPQISEWKEDVVEDRQPTLEELRKKVEAIKQEAKKKKPNKKNGSGYGL